jgi:hypothetical protein
VVGAEHPRSLKRSEGEGGGGRRSSSLLKKSRVGEDPPRCLKRVEVVWRALSFLGVPVVVVVVVNAPLHRILYDTSSSPRRIAREGNAGFEQQHITIGSSCPNEL